MISKCKSYVVEGIFISMLKSTSVDSKLTYFTILFCVNIGILKRKKKMSRNQVGKITKNFKPSSTNDFLLSGSEATWVTRPGVPSRPLFSVTNGVSA